jgi:hypothetical protein
VRLDGARPVDVGGPHLHKSLRAPAGLDHEGGAAQVADGFDGLTCRQAVGQGDDRPLGVPNTSRSALESGSTERRTFSDQ